MTLSRRLILITLPLLTIVGLEILSFQRTWFYWLAPLLLICIFFGILRLVGSKFNKDFLRLLITPFLFSVGGILFFIVLVAQGLILKHLFILLVAVLLYLILQNIFVFLYQPRDYESRSLENISNYLNLITAFLFFFSFYKLIIFHNYSFWMMEVAVILLGLCLAYQMLWVNKILSKKNILFIFIVALILAELFLALSFLPVSFYVASLILTLVYYLLIEINTSFGIGKLKKNILRRYLIVGVGVLVLLFLTMRWA